MKTSTAYDAFWFLQNHPKFKCREARLLTPKQAKVLKLSKGERLGKLKDSMPWKKGCEYLVHYFRFERDAFPENLDIFYAKVDGSQRVNEDRSKNVFVECWLEFGPIKQVVEDGRLVLRHFHDVDLDCGAPTFDEALVKLARLVKKHYGDYKEGQA